MKYEALYEGRCKDCASKASPPAPAGPTSVKPGGCRPYLKIERDTPRFSACQVIAEKVGPINSPKKAYEILREAAGHEVAERFGVMTLDTHLHLRGLAETGAGETDAVMAPRVPTLQVAIADAAAAVVIYHVHPAASTRPSEADIEVTRSFARAFDEVGILLLDHIIVATGSRAGYYSFLDSMPDAFEGTGERRKGVTAAETLKLSIRHASIRLRQLPPGQQSEVRRMIDGGEVEPIAPKDIRFPPIVRPAVNADRPFTIVDGTHRIASMYAHDERAGIPVLVVDGPPNWWREIDTDSVIGKHPVLDAIYEANADGKASVEIT